MVKHSNQSHQKSASPKQIIEKHAPKQKKTGHSKTQSAAAYLWLMPLCMAVYGLIYFNIGEIIAIWQGCGWDGCWFRDVAAYGTEQFSNKQFSPYRAQRWLPSMIVHYTSYYALLAMQGMGMEMPESATSAIVGTFRVYNLFLLIIGAWLWGLISRHLAFKTLVAWTGFGLIFGGFAIMKYSFYYPPLTDTTAFFIGIMTLYAYLLKREWLLLGAIVLGFWTWQTTFFVGMILYLFPPSAPLQAMTEMDTKILSPPLRMILTSVYALTLLVGIWLAAGLYQINFDAVEKPFVPLVYLCAFLVPLYGAYTAFFCLPVISSTSAIAQFREKAQYLRLGIAFALTAVLYSLKTIIQNSELRNEMPLSLFLGGTLSAAVAKPLLAVVASAVFYGAPLMLTLLLLPRLAGLVRSLGFGFSLIFTATVFLSGIMTESRQLINTMPFLVVPCCMFLNNVRIKTSALAGIMAMMALWSQAWVTINFNGMHDLAIRANSEVPAMQAYYRFFGPWIGMEAYLWSAFAFLLSMGILAWVLHPFVGFWSRRQQDANT